MATVANTPRTTILTLASAGAGPFLTGFRIFEGSAVEVYVNGVVNTNWSMAATFLDGYDDSTSITFNVALEIGDVIFIDGDQPAYRDYNYLNGDPGLTRKINIELARLWSSVSEIAMKLNRTSRTLVPSAPFVAEVGKTVIYTAEGFASGPSVDQIGLAAANADTAAGYVAQAEGFAETAGNAAVAAGNVLTSINAKITISVDDPTGGSEGDLWFKYTPL
jgi:hypothetical protein